MSSSQSPNRYSIENLGLARPHDCPRNLHGSAMSLRRPCGSIPSLGGPKTSRRYEQMWRKTISGGAAVLAAWTITPSPAEAHGLLFKLHGWPFAPAWKAAKLVGAGENGISKPGVNDGCPIETSDGLSLLIASNREDPNDIWAADRP